MTPYAIIVAGGMGTRMQSKIPKQFLKINGVPILALTLSKFIHYNPNIQLIVVLPKNHAENWDTIKKTYFDKVKITTVWGGATRFDSVQAGLNAIKTQGFVAIHDAVRPFISPKIIAQSLESAQKFGSGVAAIPLKDSLRKITKKSSKSKNRIHYRLVQTPQTFSISEIKKAYQNAKNNRFLDDATVYEASGYEVTLIKGSEKNIKITTPQDLEKITLFL